MKLKYFSVLLLFVVMSCASKKDIWYLQDAEENNTSEINFQDTNIQPNDILKIDIETLIPEAAEPYNIGGDLQQVSLLVFQLDGYLVSKEGMINFPVLGEIVLSNLTVNEAESEIKRLLVEGGHLNNPTVRVRVVNSKVTVLGEVNTPGTYNFAEENITLLQAIGYAGDLTINGKRDDIIMTRDAEGVRTITHINLTNTDFMSTEFFYIKPNDTIIVNQNKPSVTSSGYISSLTTLLAIASIVLSTTIILSR
ncbi:polysaccharide biosynthesis/export family protein [Psychroserpens jangbogonensis]|uniref:polysaccharide biosynthesis/export family protein n=1 Tax=Psychroserpens jangbogonensis TaxID=1484460 RepID=UPI00053DD80A|nr:polysaccharide biosynthesis/export family protein [Psychroserpens jangbogonensis]